jgi:hypothetical protein
MCHRISVKGFRIHPKTLSDNHTIKDSFHITQGDKMIIPECTVQRKVSTNPFIMLRVVNFVLFKKISFQSQRIKHFLYLLASQGK